MGNINIKREFNNVEFICEQYLNLLNYGINGNVYNICTGEVYSLKEIISILSSLTGHTINIKTNSKFIRKNDLDILCGDPKKLNDLNKRNSNFIKHSTIESTLVSMLNLSMDNKISMNNKINNNF